MLKKFIRKKGIKRKNMNNIGKGIGAERKTQPPHSKNEQWLIFLFVIHMFLVLLSFPGEGAYLYQYACDIFLQQIFSTIISDWKISLGSVHT